MGGEQSRPGTNRIPPPSIISNAGVPTTHAPGPVFVTPNDVMNLMSRRVDAFGFDSGHPSLPAGPIASIIHAQQVRSNAVVDNDSFRLVPSPNDPSTQFLEFSFTALAPVQVSVTYMCICRRGPNDSRPLSDPSVVLSRLPKSGLRHVFQAGRQKFSQLLLAQGGADWCVIKPDLEEGVGGGGDKGGLCETSTKSGGDASSPGECLDLSQCTSRELSWRPASFAGCVDLKVAPAKPARGAPAVAYPPPHPAFRVGELLAASSSSSSSAPPDIPVDMCPILVTLLALDESTGEPAQPTRCQATLCTLGAPPSVPTGNWPVKVLHQLFQVGDSVYRTQTLFGDTITTAKDSTTSPTGERVGGDPGGLGADLKSNDSGEQQGAGDVAGAQDGGGAVAGGGTLTGSDCVICLSEPRSTALLPCRHLCLCADCAQQLRFQTNKCPICRTLISSLLTWDSK